jgi:Na+/proline symporter
MNANLIFGVFLAYSLLLVILGYLTSRKSSNETFFTAGKTSPWYVVSYGMIGASLSGITFISVPGNVLHANFSYLVMVFGYLLGYLLIAYILLPIYYKLNLSSIYTYLHSRFGFYTYKTGASFFLLSRVIGASFRMFVVVSILQTFIFNQWGVPFWVSLSSFIILIWLYTNRGGIKTIIWTDTLQTTFMLASVGITIYLTANLLDLSLSGLWQAMQEKSYTKMFYFTEWRDGKYFIKMFLSGTFIALAMTGLDQDMMQKNLTCRNLKDAQKNIITLGSILIPINFIFLFLGGALFVFAAQNHLTLPADTDHIFPFIAFQLGFFPGIVFLIGLIAAAYSSADSALTALTTSFSIDILNLKERNDLTNSQKEKYRKLTHIGISIILALTILIFNNIKDDAIINSLFKIAGYTYGPLLGIFSFGLLSKKQITDRWVPFIAIAAPFVTYYINTHSEQWFNGYKFGFELLIINALITILGLFLFRKK